ncbi:MAG: hypothetical protein LQ344_003494 [Seirophora lacunosa]|nr:MAG: hypothetical protein LQ344_003494 [Seirophora lacunosa]
MRLALRLLLPLAFAVTLHAIPRGSSSENVPTTDPIPHTLPPSYVKSPVSDTHVARLSTRETRLDVTGLKKYVYRVQDTNVVLTISLGKRMERIELASFLDVTEDFVLKQTVRYGYNALLPMGTFEWSLGEELEVFAESSPALAHQMTWGVLKDAIKGLQDFLVGLGYYREAACRVSMADPAGSFVGFLDLHFRREPHQLHVARDASTIPVVKDNSNLTEPLGVVENVHLDIRPLGPFWRRLDLVAVQMLLAVTQNWAEEAAERMHVDQPILGGGLKRSLGDGVVLSMQRTPGKALTYGLVLETVKKLWAWELSTGKGRAVQFGIIDHGLLKGSGRLEKETYQRLEVAK